MAGLTNKEKEALKLFKEKLVAEFGNRLDSARLFGSKARGDAAKFSDVDVLVVLDIPHARLDVRSRVYRLANDILIDHDVDLSPKVLGKVDYQKLRSWGEPLLLNIEREGIKL